MFIAAPRKFYCFDGVDYELLFRFKSRTIVHIYFYNVKKPANMLVFRRNIIFIFNRTLDRYCRAP